MAVGLCVRIKKREEFVLELKSSSRNHPADYKKQHLHSCNIYITEIVREK